MLDWIALGLAVALVGWGVTRASRRIPVRLAFRVTAAVAVALLGVGWGAYRLSRARSFQIAGELVSRLDTDRPLVALTLDDGPTPEHTGEVLGLLARARARATLFVTGDALERRPDLGRAIVAAGHELANHSYSHRRMIGLGFGAIADEIDRTDRLIRSAGWRGDILFRPPHGKKLFELPVFLARRGRVTVLWDIEPDSDPRIARDARLIAEDVMARVRPGSIILLHVMVDSRAPSRAALPLVVAALRERGYQLVTVSELLASHAPPVR